MKNMKAIIILVTVFTIFQSWNTMRAAIRDSVTTEEIIPFVLGDINGDGIVDTVYVITPPLKIEVDSANPALSIAYDYVNYEGSNTVRFSCNLPPFKYKNSVWGRVENLGYLSNGTVCDLLFIVGWFQGCWTTAHVFQYKNKKWNEVASSVIYDCDEDSTSDRVIIKNKKFYLVGRKFDTETGDMKEYKVKIKFK